MFDIQHILIVGGYIGLFAIIFAESGVFAGFFLPGDSLLVTAGLLASQGYFNIWILAILCAVAAITGDSFGYWFGKLMGPKIFTKEDSFFFHKKHVEEAKTFFETHGRYALIIARFIPVVRTFTPIFAGVGRMPYKIFLAYNVIGGLLWAAGLTIAAYFIALSIPGFEEYFEYVILAVVAASFIPIVYKVIHTRFQKVSGRVGMFL